MAKDKRNHRGAVRQGQKVPLRDRLQWLFIAVKVMLLAAVVSGAGWGAWSGYNYLDGPVEVIVIKGDYSNVSQQELARWVEPLLHGGMISMDLEQLRNGMTTHPWVASASVSRQWPETILIEVEEEVPVARWGKSGFLNSRGQSLQIADNSNLQQLPLLTGPEGWEQQVMKQYRELAETLLVTGLQVSGVTMSQRGSWQILLHDAPTLVLGRDDLMAKVRRFLVVWEQQLEQRVDRIAQLDLRYDNGVAVRWHQPEQV